MNWFRRGREAAGKSDAELVEGIRRGDEDCWKEIFRRHHGPVFRYASQMTGSVDLAEDATQEAFVMLLEQPGRFDPALGSLGGWLLGIARKKLLKIVPSREEPPPEDAAVDAESALDVLTREEAREAVREAIDALPIVFREVVLLIEFEELAYEDAAVALGVPLGTVRSRLHRARAMLAAALGKKRRVAL